MNCPIKPGTEVVIFNAGTFNPLHGGHIEALDEAEQACKAAGLIVKAKILSPNGGQYLNDKLNGNAKQIWSDKLRRQVEDEWLRHRKDVGIDYSNDEAQKAGKGYMRRHQVAKILQQKYKAVPIIVGGETVSPGWSDQGGVITLGTTRKGGQSSSDIRKHIPDASKITDISQLRAIPNFPSFALPPVANSTTQPQDKPTLANFSIDIPTWVRIGRTANWLTKEAFSGSMDDRIGSEILKDPVLTAIIFAGYHAAYGEVAKSDYEEMVEDAKARGLDEEQARQQTKQPQPFAYNAFLENPETGISRMAQRRFCGSFPTPEDIERCRPIYQKYKGDMDAIAKSGEINIPSAGGAIYRESRGNISIIQMWGWSKQAKLYSVAWVTNIANKKGLGLNSLVNKKLLDMLGNSKSLLERAQKKYPQVVENPDLNLHSPPTELVPFVFEMLKKSPNSTTFTSNLKKTNPDGTIQFELPGYGEAKKYLISNPAFWRKNINGLLSQSGISPAMLSQLKQALGNPNGGAIVNQFVSQINSKLNGLGFKTPLDLNGLKWLLQYSEPAPTAVTASVKSDKYKINISVEKWKEIGQKAGWLTAQQLRPAYGGVVFDKDGKILIVEVAGHYAGVVYTFPKGKADPGENPETCAVREVQEETGVNATIVGKVPGSYRGSTSITEYFLMRNNDDVEHGEHDSETAQILWVTPEEAPKYLRQSEPGTAKRDLAVLAAAAQMIQSQTQQKPLQPQPEQPEPNMEVAQY